MLHQDEERKYWHRALDTYVNEAFRGVDWFLQGMRDEGQGRYGLEGEWRTVAARVGAVPAYLATARANLQAGSRPATLRTGAWWSETASPPPRRTRSTSRRRCPGSPRSGRRASRSRTRWCPN